MRNKGLAGLCWNGPPASFHHQQRQHHVSGGAGPAHFALAGHLRLSQYTPAGAWQEGHPLREKQLASWLPCWPALQWSRNQTAVGRRGAAPGSSSPLRPCSPRPHPAVLSHRPGQARVSIGCCGRHAQRGADSRQDCSAVQTHASYPAAVTLAVVCRTKLILLCCICRAANAAEVRIRQHAPVQLAHASSAERKAEHGSRQRSAALTHLHRSSSTRCVQGPRPAPWLCLLSSSRSSQDNTASS